MSTIESLTSENAELRQALHESVQLQSLYAELLNMHDGGKRIGFKNVDEWLERLRVCRRLIAKETANAD